MATQAAGPAHPPPAPPTNPQPNPPLTFTQVAHRIKKTLFHLMLLLSSLGTLTGTFFSARALSTPWTSSQTPILVTLVSLLILSLYALAYLISLTLFITVPFSDSAARISRYLHALLNKASDAAFWAALYVLHVALAVAVVMATYFAASELKGRPRVEPGLVIALMLLGPLDVLVVGGLVAFVGCGLVELCDGKGRAKLRLRNLGAVDVPERTREDAMELVRRELLEMSV